jgi:hypothetical protein
LRAGTSRKFAMPADEIRMQVSFNDVFYFEILRGSFFEILIDIALWVDHRRLAF